MFQSQMKLNKPFLASKVSNLHPILYILKGSIQTLQPNSPEYYLKKVNNQILVCIFYVKLSFRVAENLVKGKLFIFLWKLLRI